MQPAVPGTTPPETVGQYTPDSDRRRAAAALRFLGIPAGTLVAVVVLNAYQAGRTTAQVAATIESKLDARRFVSDSSRRVVSDTSVLQVLRQIQETQREQGARLTEICRATQAGCR